MRKPTVSKYDPGRVVHGQRTEEECVGQAHDSARQSEAKRERSDRRQSEARGLRHPPQRDRDVLQEMVERGQALLISIVLSKTPDGSERDEGAASRLGW